MNTTYLRPKDLNEAVAILQKWGRDARLFCGGTDLFLALRAGLIDPKVIVDVGALPELRRLDYDPKTGLTVGAAVSLADLRDSPLVNEHTPILVEAANSVGSYQLMTSATLGGNLGNASPAGDTLSPLYVYEANAHLWSTKGERTIGVQDVITGPKQTVIHEDEIISHVTIPPPPKGAFGRYLKYSRRRAVDLAIVGVTVMGYPEAAAAGGYAFRIALGAVAPTPIRIPKAEKLLAESKPSEQAFREAAQAVVDSISPIEDIRTTADHRRAVAEEYTLRALRSVAENLGIEIQG